MEQSDDVRDAVLDFYRGVSEKQVERFDEIVSGHEATLIIGTAPGEWVTERPRLRFGFETEGFGSRPDRPQPAGARGRLAGSPTSRASSCRRVRRGGHG